MFNLFNLYFNSIKVRLEPILINTDYILLLNFNSIKVRLELLKLICYKLTWIFQFHKGAIRTWQLVQPEC